MKGGAGKSSKLWRGDRRDSASTGGGKEGKGYAAAIPVVVKPGGIAGDDDVVGLLRHVVLVQVWVLGLLPFVARAVLILVL